MEECLFKRKKKQARDIWSNASNISCHVMSCKRRIIELLRRTATQERTGSRHLEVAAAEEEVNLDPLGLLEPAKRVVDDVQLPVHAALHRDLHGSAR
jgi:hypothetical protein